MRQTHCTITPAVVRSTARAALRRALPWKAHGRRVIVARLLDLLLLVAALRSSLSAVVRRFRFGFSHETARQAVRANLPSLDRLTGGLVNALHVFGSRRWRKRRWDVAIDLHYCPFYGDRGTKGIVGGPKKPYRLSELCTVGGLKRLYRVHRPHEHSTRTLPVRPRRPAPRPPRRPHRPGRPRPPRR